MKRIFLIVLDSCGVGYEPDADKFGDVGSDTLRRCATSAKFDMTNLVSMGLGNLEGIDYLPRCEAPKAALARLQERSMGKDTTIGHWEIAGVVSENPLHEPIDATAHDQIQLRRLLRIIPNVRHCTEDRGVDTIEFLKLVNDNRQRFFLRMLDENAKDIFKTLGSPHHRQIANLGNLLLKPRTKITLGFPCHIKVEIRTIFKCPLDQLCLANTPPSCDNSKPRRDN